MSEKGVDTNRHEVYNGYGFNLNYFSEEYWRTDLNKSQFEEVENRLRKKGSPEKTKITDTSNWYSGILDEEDLFVIYSTEDANNPTILYEVKGENANLERDILLDILEEYENGESVDGKSTYVSWIFGSGWMQPFNRIQNNFRNMGRGQNNQNVRVLQRQSQRNGSRAFWNVVENIFGIQAEKSNDRIKKSRSEESLDTESYFHTYRSEDYFEESEGEKKLSKVYSNSMQKKTYKKIQSEAEAQIDEFMYDGITNKTTYAKDKKGRSPSVPKNNPSVSSADSSLYTREPK